MRVAYQGESGAFSEAGAIEHFGSEVTTISQDRFEGVFQAVNTKQCEAGFIPIENSRAGSIHQNYDLLAENQLYITGEHYLRVRHCLIAVPGAEVSDIRCVISHPQALNQCRNSIKEFGIEASDPVYDTAGAVKMIAVKQDVSVAAIASRRAAELYGMNILAEGIEDVSSNYTRFLIIKREPVTVHEDAKTSLVFSLSNQPGALFKALSTFALRDIDLTKIESRPLVGKPWDYLFYIDLAGSTEDTKVSRALENLGEYATMLRVLGSYPRHKLFAP